MASTPPFAEKHHPKLGDINTVSRNTTTPIMTGKPETHFKTRDIVIDPPAVRALMSSGSPTRDESGAERPGSFGVLVDNVLGYSIIASAPKDHWAVTTEMSIDFLGTFPGQHETITADARLVDTDGFNGYSEGTLTDDAGRVWARMRQRGRIIADSPVEKSTANELTLVENAADGKLTLDQILGLQPVSDNADALCSLQITESHINPLGNLHGGMALCLSEVLGNRHLNNEGDAELYTGSVQVSYLRPAPLGAQITLRVQTVHRGRTMGVSQVVATLPNGKPVTMARITAYAR